MKQDRKNRLQISVFRCISQELKKNFYFPYVSLTITGILILLLMSAGEISEAGKSISIFVLMLQGRKAAAGQIEKSALVLWKQGMGEWLILFLPLLLTFGYIMLISEERQHGQVKFQLIRSGNLRYCISKILSGALFGGIIFMTAYMLFGILMMAFFPLFSSFSLEEQSLYREIYFGNHIDLYVIKRLTGTFLYGAFASVFGIGVSIVFRDKYMLMCLPFLLNYMYRRVLTKLLVTAALHEGPVELIEAFYPDSIMQISLNRYWAISVLLLLLVYTGVTILFYWNLKRSIKRGDCGE